MNINKKAVGFEKNIKNHGLLFHYNIAADNMLGVFYVAVIRISCRCSTCVSKLYSPWNIRQDKYNQY